MGVCDFNTIPKKTGHTYFQMIPTEIQGAAGRPMLKNVVLFGQGLNEVAAEVSIVGKSRTSFLSRQFFHSAKHIQYILKIQDTQKTNYLF